MHYNGAEDYWFWQGMEFFLEEFCLTYEEAFEAAEDRVPLDTETSKRCRDAFVEGWLWGCNIGYAGGELERMVHNPEPISLKAKKIVKKISPEAKVSEESDDKNIQWQ